MTDLLAKLFKLARGSWQWFIIWLFHDKFIIGVVGIILNERNEVLLAKHRFWKSGPWGLIGGHTNRNETLEEGLAREAKEETGLSITDISLFKLVSGFQLRIEAFYTARAKAGDITIDSKEILEARFFGFDALPAELLASHRQLLQEYCQKQVIT